MRLQRTVLATVALSLATVPASAAVKRRVSLVYVKDGGGYAKGGVRVLTFASGWELNKETKTDRFEAGSVYASIPDAPGGAVVMQIRGLTTDPEGEFDAQDFREAFTHSPTLLGTQLLPTPGREWMLAAKLDKGWLDPEMKE
jgi:hypothetical protein